MTEATPLETSSPDSRTGALGLSFQYVVEGRLEQVELPNGSTPAVYRYDPLDRLVSRQLASTGATTLYFYDTTDQIIAETDTAGVTTREYIWLNDLPLAVVRQEPRALPCRDQGAGAPAFQIAARNGFALWKRREPGAALGNAPFDLA